MRLIAHRGNVFGPEPDKENSPEYLRRALYAGYDVEVDLWIKNRSFFTGHDSPQYALSKVDIKELMETYKSRVWFHIKDNDFSTPINHLNYFIQKDEEFVITSTGVTWYHAEATPQKGSIATILNTASIPISLQKDLWGICSDVCEDLVELPHIKRHNSSLFDVLVLDVDGVLCPNKAYNREGEVVSKTFCDLDWTAIKRFKAAGIDVVFLSGDKWNKKIAKKRNIDFYHTPAKDGMILKGSRLEEICERYDTFPFRVAYVGDDFYDKSLLSKVGFAYCPYNALWDIGENVKRLDVRAGEGVVAELFHIHKHLLKEGYPYDHL